MNKHRLLFRRLVYVLIFITLAAVAGVMFLPTYKWPIFTVALISSAGAALLNFVITTGLEKRIRASENVVNKIDDYAQVLYNRRTETAVASRNFTDITGLALPEGIMDEVDYKKLMTEVISYPSDMGADIYMAAKPEKWIKVRTFDEDVFEVTIINDVSEYVSCKNIIKSMKYYDNETGLLCRESFVAKLASVSAPGAGAVALISLSVSGTERLISFKGTAAVDRMVHKTASFIKKFENPHNVFAGRIAANKFTVLVTEAYEESAKKYADKIYHGLVQALSALEGSEYITVYCGYKLFENEDIDAHTMMSEADYAVYEAKDTDAAEPVKFNSENYEKRVHDFKKIQVFNTIVNRNKLCYHFQPIVDAHTGDIFAYEALMRPEEIDGIRLTPPEVISIAQEQGMAEEIENITFSNTIKYLTDHKDFFADRKLFINVIPNCFISNEDYLQLLGSYGEAFSKLVIEITEGVPITRESMETMRERYRINDCLIAVDDYGTSYAGESELISVKPDFIKIDRSLIDGIDSDVRKQHLVSNMIGFARSHGIKTLAEGVETKGELEILITFGVDYIQGYYTSRPNPLLVVEIPENVKGEIIDINARNVGYTKKVYTLEASETVDITALAAEGVTDIAAAGENVTLRSGKAQSVSMGISCADGFEGTLNIENVNISGHDAPVLTLGNNCKLTLNVIGENSFSGEGIRVPETSSLTVAGSGRLSIEMNSSEGVVIGGDHLRTFGSVTVDMDGSLELSSQSENIVAIGGSAKGEGAVIDIRRGKVTAELKGVSIVGIGAVTGGADIRLGREAVIDINAGGKRIAAIGSQKGCVNIESEASVTAVCAGDNCCAVGTLNGGSGSVKLESGKYSVTVNAKSAVGIGSVNGSVSAEISDGEYNISCEANSATGIGDSFGSGDVTVSGGTFRLHISASAQTPIGTASGKTVISGGNIVSDSREAINAVSPFDEPLEETRIESKSSFGRKVSSEKGEYTYTAEPVDGFVTVYLPAEKKSG